MRPIISHYSRRKSCDENGNSLKPTLVQANNRHMEYVIAVTEFAG
jgi:hypothetical protein